MNRDCSVVRSLSSEWIGIESPTSQRPVVLFPLSSIAAIFLNPEGNKMIVRMKDGHDLSFKAPENIEQVEGAAAKLFSLIDPGANDE